MIFLIQTINDEIVHDFSFTLIEAIKYQNWARSICSSKDFEYRKIERFSDLNLTRNLDILRSNDSIIPIGTVEFVIDYLKKYYNKTPAPINIPRDLQQYKYTKRIVYNSINEEDFSRCKFPVFVKSDVKIKGFNEIVNTVKELPDENVFISEIVDIYSEWRCFVYNKKLVGLQNYLGHFALFPDVDLINEMISTYTESPIAYTLDVGINEKGTYVIEVHDFFSCGLYGFSDFKILPYMYRDWFKEFVNRK